MTTNHEAFLVQTAQCDKYRSGLIGNGPFASRPLLGLPWPPDIANVWRVSSTAVINNFRNEFRDRGPQMAREFRAAIAAMPEAELREWACRIPAIACAGAVRRGSRLKNLVTAAVEVSQREWRIGRLAWHDERLLPHLKSRAHVTGEGARDLALRGREMASACARSVAENPREKAPVLVSAVIGFMLSSGGPQGDGGIPDLDLLGGIGDHRSLLTHTIVAGIVTETMVLCFVDLAGRVHDYLPLGRDPLWDHLDQRNSQVVDALLGGVSAGFAYHFAVDATVDADGAYALGKGILPAALDDAFQASNAVVEGVQVPRSQRSPQE